MRRGREESGDPVIGSSGDLKSKVSARIGVMVQSPSGDWEIGTSKKHSVLVGWLTPKG
jgi:hypothetical protein